MVRWQTGDVPKLEPFDSQDDIPEALRDYYVERDGKWVPDAPELYEKGRAALDGERAQRAAAIKRAEAAEARARDLEAKLKAAPTADPAQGGGGDTEAAAARLKREYDERIKAIEQKLELADKRAVEAEQKLDESSLSDSLRSTLLELGVPKAAVEDLVHLPRFREPWRKTESGEFAPFEGDLPRYDPDNPKRPMSAKAYAKEYLKDNAHWLPPSNGGGASGSGANRTPRVITVSREELRDAASYERIQGEAAKTGATIQYTD